MHGSTGQIQQAVISYFTGTHCPAADLTHHIKLDHLFKGRAIIPKVINIRASLPSCISDTVIAHITEIFFVGTIDILNWPFTESIRDEVFKRKGRMARACKLWGLMDCGKELLSNEGRIFSCQCLLL